MTDFTPEDISFHAADDIFFKQYRLPKDALVPQHAHEWDHTTLVCSGRIRAWCGEELLGEFEGPHVLTIPAHSKHTFLALADTVIYCIHNMRGREEYKISEEHGLWHSA